MQSIRPKVDATNMGIKLWRKPVVVFSDYPGQREPEETNLQFRHRILRAHLERGKDLVAALKLFGVYKRIRVIGIHGSAPYARIYIGNSRMTMEITYISKADAISNGKKALDEILFSLDPKVIGIEAEKDPMGFWSISL